MKKIILFCTVAAIVAGVYWGCKKEQPATVENAKPTELMMAQAQNEFTVDEFEVELTSQLNENAIKKQPMDKSYNRIKEVGVIMNDLKVEMVTDSTGKISKSELQRVYIKVKNDVWAAAQNEFAGGKDRVLGFMLDEEINLPKAAIGVIQDITVKLTGIIGNGVFQIPNCTFTQNYVWPWNSQFPPQTMLDEMEAVLNSTSPPCLPNFLSTCPAPGKTEKNLPNGTALYQIDGGDCMPGTPFICVLWLEALSCKQPCPDSFFGPSDLQYMVDGARQNSIYWLNVQVIPYESPRCFGNNIDPAPLFQLSSFVEGWGTFDLIKHITITYRYYGCGPCKAKSIKIP